MLFQRLGDHVHIHLAVAEDDRVGAAFAFGLDEGAQGGAFVGKAAILAQRLHLDQGLRDCQRGGCLTRNLDPGGVVQEGVGDPLDLGRHGGAVEHGLAGKGGQLEDAFDVGDEPHVEHPVRLIDHHDLHAGQKKLATLEMVQEPAGGGDQHIDATVNQLVLFAERHAANQQSLGQLGVLGIGLEILGHLSGEFAGWRQHKTARHPGAGAALTQKRNHRQHEACGLAGAGLGDAQYVTALQGVRDGLGLNWGRGFIAGFGNGLKYARVQREVGKFGHLRPMNAVSDRMRYGTHVSGRPGVAAIFDRPNRLT